MPGHKKAAKPVIKAASGASGWEELDKLSKHEEQTKDANGFELIKKRLNQEIEAKINKPIIWNTILLKDNKLFKNYN